MTHLVNKNCRVIDNDEVSLQGDDLTHYRAQIDNSWSVVEEEHLSRRFMFSNYQEAVEFTNQVADVADSEGHHPEIKLSYGEVEVKVTTHELGGLHENDFIVAAKIDRQHRDFREEAESN